MARGIRTIETRLADLEAPQLDLGQDSPEVFLDRLRVQNSALDRLRTELAAEELVGPLNPFVGELH